MAEQTGPKSLERQRFAYWNSFFQFHPAQLSQPFDLTDCEVMKVVAIPLAFFEPVDGTGDRQLAAEQLQTAAEGTDVWDVDEDPAAGARDAPYLMERMEWIE